MNLHRVDRTCSTAFEFTDGFLQLPNSEEGAFLTIGKKRLFILIRLARAGGPVLTAPLISSNPTGRTKGMCAMVGLRIFELCLRVPFGVKRENCGPQ